MKLCVIVLILLAVTGCAVKSAKPISDSDKTKYKFHVCTTVKKGCKYAEADRRKMQYLAPAC